MRIGRDGEKVKDGLWGFREGVASDGQIRADGDVVSCLAIIDRATCCVGGGEWEGVVGETEDVDLEIGEGMPKGGLDKRLERRKLDDRHADGKERCGSVGIYDTQCKRRQSTQSRGRPTRSKPEARQPGPGEASVSWLCLHSICDPS